MADVHLYYATNRNHEGKDASRPDGYGRKFSDDGMENLRFGRVTIPVNAAEVDRYVGRDMAIMGRGDGNALAAYLCKQAKQARIKTYREQINRRVSDRAQPNAKLGSAALFSDLHDLMLQRTDVLLYLHGFNVTWHEAVGTAAALEIMLNRSAAADSAQSVSVVLFTWPSDGLAMPFASYKSDRTEAAGSGYAVGRGLLKARDFLASLRDRVRDGAELCQQDIHLMCHSMGAYLLQTALERLCQFTPGKAMPRLFEHVFLCAPDVDDDVLEPGRAMGNVHEVARCVTVYHNRNDVAMVVSDHTKGHPERLGAGGAARPRLLHTKLHQVDCTPIAIGPVQHSYYLSGSVRDDIRQSIDGMGLEDQRRRRLRDVNATNVWVMK